MRAEGGKRGRREELKERREKGGKRGRMEERWDVVS
jgi:hypothetical protein